MTIKLKQNNKQMGGLCTSVKKSPQRQQQLDKNKQLDQSVKTLNKKIMQREALQKIQKIYRQMEELYKKKKSHEDKAANHAASNRKVMAKMQINNAIQTEELIQKKRNSIQTRQDLNQMILEHKEDQEIAQEYAKLSELFNPELKQRLGQLVENYNGLKVIHNDTYDLLKQATFSAEKQAEIQRRLNASNTPPP